jgi:solute carrier family 25 carnitine/acylcarnitine transporter 20/29
LYDFSVLIFGCGLSCVQKLWAEGGLGRFYRGFTPCILRSCPANAAMLVTVDYVGNQLNK